MQPDARAILYVDDEAHSRKWFARCFGDEFEIATAASADDALAILDQRGQEFAALVTDYRMPEQDGMKLLRQVQRDHRHLVRLLATAYAEKDVAIAAVNQGKVLRILEKPLEDEPTREALREALALYRTQAMERMLNEGRVSALRETLGFLAHELNTPLATVRGCVASVASRHKPAAGGTQRAWCSSRRTIPATCWPRSSAPSAARCIASRWWPPSCSRRAMPIRARRRRP